MSGFAPKRLKLRRVAKYAFRLAPYIASGVAIADGVPPIWLVVGGGFLGWAAVEEKLFKSSEETKIPPAAFVYDAQRHLAGNDGRWRVADCGHQIGHD